MSGTVFVTVCQLLLESKLALGLQGKVQNLDSSALSSAGITSLTSLVSLEELPVVLEVYNDALRSIWYLALGLACLIFVTSFGMEWRSVKKEKNKEKMETDIEAEPEADSA